MLELIKHFFASNRFVTRQRQYYLWLLASILVAILFSLSGFGLAFDSPYTVQDDARQHVFWLQKLNDPILFNNDLIADYFSSVAPFGYKFLYWLANKIGIEPFLFNKLLPVLIGVATSIFTFLVTLEIFPVPFAGFVASLLLNQNLWMLDDLVSGTPRAFFYVLFLGFIYYLLRQNLIACCLFIALQGLFYPQVLLISSCILCLFLVTPQQKKYFYIAGLVVAIAVIFIYKLQAGNSHEVIDLELAKQLPEFQTEGRNSFFIDDFWSYWLVGQRSGYFPREWQYVLLCSFGLLLPVLIKRSHTFPLAKQINPNINIITKILIASLILFCLSHLLLFKLHLPSRYTQHTWRIVIALVDGITLAIVIDKFTQFKPKLRPLIVIIVLGALLYPTHAVQSYPYRLGYVTGNSPELYQFLQRQPKNVLIASLSSQADFIPSLAKRSVLVSEEYSIPYHWDYYQQIRQRAKDLIHAQYSYSQTEIEQFINKYKIDLWLIDKDAFTTQYLKNNAWLNQFQPETKNAINKLNNSDRLFVQNQEDRCAVFKTPQLYVLDTRCMIFRLSVKR